MYICVCVCVCPYEAITVLRLIVTSNEASGYVTEQFLSISDTDDHLAVLNNNDRSLYFYLVLNNKA